MFLKFFCVILLLLVAVFSFKIIKKKLLLFKAALRDEICTKIRDEICTNLRDEICTKIQTDIYDNVHLIRDDIHLNNIQVQANIDNAQGFLKDEIKEQSRRYTNLELKYYQEFNTDIKLLSESDYEQFTGDIAEEYKTLINGLDDESIGIVVNILTRLKLNYLHHVTSFWMTNEEYEDLRKIYDMHSSHIIQLSPDIYAYGKYLLPVNLISTTVFYYKHFVDRLTNTEILKDLCIIDVGAGIGDSAIILSQYTNKEVHCFEPTTQSFENLCKTVKLNSLKNIICNQYALGANNCAIPITVDGDYSTCCNVQENKNVVTELVQVKKLDDYVKEKNLKVGLIKVDIEGFEQEFLKGAKETICSQRPALLMSIYHNADDFFNIKPILESWGIGYKFKIVKPHDKSIIVDTTLIAEYLPD